MWAKKKYIYIYICLTDHPPVQLKGPCQPVCFAGVESSILAYIEIVVLGVLAFSEDFLRYVNDLRSGVLRHHYIIEFLYIFVFFFSIELSFCQKKLILLWSGQMSRTPPKRGRPPLKTTRRFCCERPLSISGTRRRLILVFRETPIANLRSFFYIVWSNVSNLNKKA